MIIPETEANSKVMTRIGHEPDNEASRGLEVCCTSFTKNATPGDSTVVKVKK